MVSNANVFVNTPEIRIFAELVVLEYSLFAGFAGGMLCFEWYSEEDTYFGRRRGDAAAHE